jgi:hypothetical protein
MAEIESPYCPECDEAFAFPEPLPVDRRHFIRVVGGAAATVALGAAGSVHGARAETKTEKKTRPAEELIKELFSGLKDEQKKKVVLPYDHGTGKGRRPTRLGMYNAAIHNIRIETVYTKAQTELIERIVKAMSSGDDGYRRISRGGTWDATGTFARCGALFFGQPTWPHKCAFVFTGHHLTIRTDGDFQDGTAFAGPIYYGHSPNGYSRGNLFNYQTQSVISLHNALDLKQRDKATIAQGNPGEMDPSIKFRTKAEDRPGLAIADLSKDQKALVEKVMRDVLSPFRKEDVDEVMLVIKRIGGMEKIKLAFFADNYEGAKTSKEQPWSFWRLEGPGFVWNFRVLPHVHTYVNISSKLV